MSKNYPACPMRYQRGRDPPPLLVLHIGRRGGVICLGERGVGCEQGILPWRTSKSLFCSRGKGVERKKFLFWVNPASVVAFLQFSYSSIKCTIQERNISDKFPQNLCFFVHSGEIVPLTLLSPFSFSGSIFKSIPFFSSFPFLLLPRENAVSSKFC